MMIFFTGFTNCFLLRESMPTSILQIPQGPLLPSPGKFRQSQLLKDEVSDLLTFRASSSWHSSETDFGGGFLFPLQPLEKMARVTKTIRPVTDSDIEMAEQHLASAVGWLLTVHSNCLLLCLRHYFTRGRGLSSHFYQLIIISLTITYMFFFLP